MADSHVIPQARPLDDFEFQVIHEPKVFIKIVNKNTNQLVTIIENGSNEITSQNIISLHLQAENYLQKFLAAKD